jgi:hypothetical protein
MPRRRGSTGPTGVMPYTTFLAISATIVTLVLSACSGSSRGKNRKIIANIEVCNFPE